MGANPALSWFGVIGYSAASACPALIVCMIGPRIRSFTGEKAFCATDYGLARYGRVMQFAIGCISVFYSEYTKTTVRIAMSKKKQEHFLISSSIKQLFILPSFLPQPPSVHIHGLRNDLNLECVQPRCWFGLLQ
jgi:hypothetical protein